MKWLWRFSSQEQPLWKDTINARYGMNTRWINNIATQPYGTGVWRTIRNLCPKLINKCIIKIGDGGKTLLWEEVWVGQASLKASFLDLFSLSLQKVATVKEMRDAQGWNLRQVQKGFHLTYPHYLPNLEFLIGAVLYRFTWIKTEVVVLPQGRGIETNLYAQFRCDSLKIGMVKHPEVVEFLGGRLYDCVFKYNEVLE
ncbi:hypothetical protein MTR67_006730 [Solanum verrucosum]|uniref:Reverse transcriptase zinc-binding domain-containing protein n=1 Tax=Solanum verrucosum TaxID=315347 RepID=A0AAF0THH1_SOLVR|nr:hypothetical protein MTR67_006730 [Solanum verrucosum]